MSATIKELGIDRLDVEDRIALVEEIWDSIAAEARSLPLSDSHRMELEARFAEDEQHPGDLAAWDEIRTATLARLK